MSDSDEVESGNPLLKVTRIAREGLDFATLFTAKFMREDINNYQPVMREPHGGSTGGGKQALQHIVLEPKIQGDPSITIGQANVVTKTAKVRTYSCLQRMHQLRFKGRPFALSHQTYQEFFDKMLEFMQKNGMQVEVETQPPSVAAVVPAEASTSGSALAWVVLLCLMIAAAIGGWLVYTGKI